MSLFKKIYGLSEAQKPYENYNDYLSDNFKLVEVILIHFIKIIGEIGKAQGNAEQLMKSGLKDVAELKKRIKEKTAANKKFFYAGEYVQKRYRLSDFQWFCVVSLISYEVSGKHRRLFKKINAFFGQEDLSFDALYKIYNFLFDIKDICSGCKEIDDAKYRLEALCLEHGKLEVSKRIFDFIVYNAQKSLSIPGVEVFLPTAGSAALPIREETAVRINNFIKTSEKKEVSYIYIQGDNGIGKRTVIKRAAQISNQALIMINVLRCQVDDKEKFASILTTCFREATLCCGYIAISGIDALYEDVSKYKYHIDFIFDKIGSYSKVVFILSDTDLKGTLAISGSKLLQIDLEIPDSRERLILWEKSFESIKEITDVKACEMANKFSFSPGQIAGTVSRAKNLSLSKSNKKLDEKDMCECAYSQIVNTLSEKATRVKSKHTWKDLILNPKEKEMLKSACAQVKYKHIVYDEWKMKDRILYGRGVSMLFAGPPGTGKTMAAGVISNELGLEIYRVDLSQVVSKYIGETEKNLNSIFNEAKSSNVILFFDETDALFGKRTEVKDSHDKNANIETSFLLQKMEEYEGITIMTTNFLQNIDSAFFRRINYVIHFEFPDKNARKKIWENMFPESVPREKNIDFEYLARQFEIAGGNIKNIALTSLFLAAKSEKKVLGMKHILTALKYELKKQGKTLLKDDFSEYGYMMENDVN